MTLASNTAKALFRHAVPGSTVEVNGVVGGQTLSGVYNVKASRSQSGRTGQRFLMLGRDGSPDVEIGWRRDPLTAFVVKSIPSPVAGEGDNKSATPRATQGQTLSALMETIGALKARIETLEGRATNNSTVAPVAAVTEEAAPVAETAASHVSDMLDAITAEESASDSNDDSTDSA